jgi:hypothetical protein
LAGPATRTTAVSDIHLCVVRPAKASNKFAKGDSGALLAYASTQTEHRYITSTTKG